MATVEAMTAGHMMVNPARIGSRRPVEQAIYITLGALSRLATWAGSGTYATGLRDLYGCVLPALKERPISAGADAYHRYGGLNLAPDVLHDHSV